MARLSCVTSCFLKPGAQSPRRRPRSPIAHSCSDHGAEPVSRPRSAERSEGSLYAGEHRGLLRGRWQTVSTHRFCGRPENSTEDNQHGQDSSDAHRQRRLSWAKMIQKVYEIDPLLCSFCGGEVKILSFITKPKTIKKILDAMDLPSQKPEPLAHSPPLFRDTTYVPL